MAFGSLVSFIAALVGLEETIDPSTLTVSPWRPARIDGPTLYNILLESPADIPGTQLTRDTINIGIRIAVQPGDIDEEQNKLAGYFDQARAVIDADLIQPSESVLHATALMCRRTSSRNVIDTFNGIDYLCLELTLTAEFRQQFQ